MDEILIALKKLVENRQKFVLNKDNNYDEYEQFKNFVKFLKNESMFKIFNQIKEEIAQPFDNYILSLPVNSLKLTKEEHVSLYSIFLMRSMFVSFWREDSGEPLFLSLDEGIGNFLKLEKKFWVFYYQKELRDIDELRKDLFKIYVKLAYKQIILEKKIRLNKKTPTMISLGDFSLEWSIFEKIKISETPFVPMKVGSNYYFISDFFLKTSEIFRPNAHSGERLKLNNIRALEPIARRFGIISETDFKRVKGIYECDIGLKVEKTEEEIKYFSKLMEVNREKIKKLDLINKFNYLESIRKIIKEDFSEYNWVSEGDSDLVLYAYKKIIERKIPQRKKLIQDPNILVHFFYLIYREDKTLKKREKDLDVFLNFLETKDFSVPKDLFAKLTDVTRIIPPHLLEKNEKILIRIYKKNLDNEDLKLNYKNKSREKKIVEELNKNYQKKISSLFNLFVFSIIEAMNIFEKKIYFSFFLDFRGRLYFDSIISVTNFKPSRYFMNYGYYSKENIDKLKKQKRNRVSSIIENYDEIILIILEKFSINFRYLYIKEAVFWILLSIGKEFTKKIRESYSLTEIIDRGLSTLTQGKEFSELNKKITLSHYVTILKSLNEERPLKRFIHKDATGSFIQNKIRLLGAKDRNSLVMANLDSIDRWYDVYALAIIKWKETLILNGSEIILEKSKGVPAELLKYFVRSSIKSVVMVTPYSATFLTKWNYFCDKIEEIFQENIKNNKEILRLFTSFSKYVEDSFWMTNFIKKSSEFLNIEILKQLKEKKTAYVFAPDARANLIYYKSTTKKIDVSIKIKELGIEERRIKNYQELDKEKIWSEKMKQATKANWVHFSDAEVMRQIVYKTNLWPVHDCFFVDVFGVSRFIVISNLPFKNEEWGNTFSIFVFI